MILDYPKSVMLGDKGKDEQLAGVRDKAIALAQAIKEVKEDDVEQILEQRKTSLTEKPGAITETVDLHKLIDFDDLMAQFEPERKGGKELEKKLKTYAGKRAALSADDVKDAALLAQQCAVIAQFTEAMA